LGEAIAFASQNRKRRLSYQRSWINELHRLPSELQDLAIQVLVHLAIQPRERMIYLYEEDEYQISFEEAVMLDGRDYTAIVDAVRGCVIVGEEMFALKTRLQRAILARLTFNDGKLVPKETLLEAVAEDLEEELDAKALDKGYAELTELLSEVGALKFEGKKTGYKVKLGKNIVRLLPILVADPDLSEEQISLIRFFQQKHQGTIQDVTDSTTLSRAVARRELQHLSDCGYVEVVKEGRSQIYRLR
jgi:DNA-binding transcriptional ArsR family regulator